MSHWTPEFLGKAEDEMNDTLRRARPGHRVCLHPNRTIKKLPGTWGDHMVECDYCPTTAYWGPDKPMPDLMPNYYLDRG